MLREEPYNNASQIIVSMGLSMVFYGVLENKVLDTHVAREVA
jgi:hypothetical protein